MMSHALPHCFTFLLLSLLFVDTLLWFVLVWRYKGTERADAGLPLPPGSMGWLCVGETLQLYSQDPNIFFASKQKRYGEIFKTHLLGCPCVKLASPQATQFVLVTQSHLFKPTRHRRLQPIEAGLQPVKVGVRPLAPGPPRRRRHRGSERCRRERAGLRRGSRRRRATGRSRRRRVMARLNPRISPR